MVKLRLNKQGSITSGETSKSKGCNDKSFSPFLFITKRYLLCFFKHYSVNDFRINVFGIMCLTNFFKKVIF